MTINQYGEGVAYYVGTEPSVELAAKLTDMLISKHKLHNFGTTPDGVEIVHRAVEEKDYIFVINHTNEKKRINIPSDWKPYYEGQSVSLAPFAADVYTRTQSH